MKQSKMRMTKMRQKTRMLQNLMAKNQLMAMTMTHQINSLLVMRDSNLPCLSG